jgi:hypothetical protein
VLELLDDIRALLGEHHVDRLVDELGNVRHRPAQAVDSANTRVILGLLVQMRQLYGGIGTLSDVCVSDRAGDKIDPGQVRSVNSRLQRLRTELFNSIGQEIERLGERDGGALP